MSVRGMSLQVSLPTGAGGRCLSSPAIRRLSAFVDNIVFTLPAVFASLSGPNSERIRHADSDVYFIFYSLGAAIKLSRDGMGEWMLTLERRPPSVVGSVDG